MRHSTAIPIAIVFIFLVGLAGFFLGGAGVFHPVQNIIQTPDNANRKLNNGQNQVVLFFLKSDPTNFYLKPVLFEIKNGGDRHRKALEALFSGPPKGSNLLGLFPKETAVLSLTVQNGLATVNLNRSATKLNVGSSGELLAVTSIVNTLTKFPDVFRVKILVEGKSVESLAGHVDLTEPLRYNDQVIDPELFTATKK